MTSDVEVPAAMSFGQRRAELDLGRREMALDGDELLVGARADHDRLADDRAVVGRRLRAGRAVLRVAREADPRVARGRRRARPSCSPAAAATIALAIVTVSWFSPESMTSCWPARKPNGTCSRTPGRADGGRAVERRPQRVVGELVDDRRQVGERGRDRERVRVLGRVAGGVLQDTACVCLPTVSRLSATVFGTMNWPSSSIRRIAAPPAPLATVSLASRRRGSVRSGVSVWDCRILPSTIDGW